MEMLFLGFGRQFSRRYALIHGACNKGACFFGSTALCLAKKRQLKLNLPVSVAAQTDKRKKPDVTLPSGRSETARRVTGRKEGAKQRSPRLLPSPPPLPPSSSSSQGAPNKLRSVELQAKKAPEDAGNKSGNETAAPRLCVDAISIVEEWGRACVEDTDVDGEVGTEAQQESDNGGSFFPAVSGTKGAATFGAFFARAVKKPEDFPVLNHVLFSHKHDNLGTCDVRVLHVENVVRNPDHLFAFVNFLRVYRTSTFSNVRVYEVVLGELVQATIALWKQSCCGVTKERRDEGAVAAVKTAIIWLLLELRQIFFEATPLEKVSGASKGQGRTKTKGLKGGKSCDHRKWLENITQHLLLGVVVPAADCILKEANDRELMSSAEGVIDMILVFLASEIAKELGQYTERIDCWERSNFQMAKLVGVFLQDKSSEEVMRNSSLEIVRAHVFDLLDALRLWAMVDTFIPLQLREQLRRDASEYFLKLSGGVKMRTFIFTDVFCTTEMAKHVRSLLSRDLIEIVETAIFMGAALFCDCADEAAVNKMLLSVRTKVQLKSDSDDIDVDVDGKCNKETYSKRGFPRSRRAKVAFALFYVGFDPEAVLGSGLCVGLNALEVLELVSAAGFFSRSFALSPLPTRLSTLLITEGEALINACIRADNVLGHTHREKFVGGPKPLCDIWEEYMSMDSSESFLRGDVVPFPAVLYMSLTTAVELLVRGEERKLSAQLVRLLALLERGGSYHYLIDGLSLLIDGCIDRFCVAGQFQHSSKKRFESGTSLEVERSLSEVTALFVPRVIEAVQRQMAKAKRDSAMSGADGLFASQILQEMLHFTVYVAACGMNSTTAKQLVGVHTMLVKGLVSRASDSSLSLLSDTIVRMNFLLAQVGAKRRDFGMERHHASPGLRHCSVFLNDVVAAHLKPIAAEIRCGGRIAASQERYQLLSIVSLLFRLVSENAVEAEPADLRSFRTDVLDPALTRVLQEQNSGAGNFGETLDLDALSEITVVMCLPHTIHHFSPQLLNQLTIAVTVAASKQCQLSYTEEQRRHLSKTAARLLVSAAAVCQLRQEERTAQYITVVQALGPLLLPAEVSTLLWSFVTYQVPVDSSAVVALRTFLAEEASSPKSTLSFLETISALQVLCDLGDTSRLAYTTILRRIINSGYQLSPGEVGIVVRIATRLQQLSGDLPVEDLHFLQGLSVSLADEALRVRQQCSPSDVPLVLQGFSRLTGDRYGDLRDRVMKAYILRTIQVRLLLGPKEIVECLESYAAARVAHQYLFGVLLARVTDLKLKFSLPLAVRLVKCGVNATWDKNVQTACLTAAHPVFLGLVRYLLESDPASLPSVSSNAVMVLECLTEAFPNDPTSELVLQNMASHYTALSFSTMVAVLKLVARKTSTEYSILRCMTEHSANVLFPQAAPKAFAYLTQLFVHCGVRSRVLFDAVSKRFKEVSKNCNGSVLATLAEAFIVAHVDLEQGVISTFVEHTVALLKEKHVVFELSHCVSVLKLFSHLDLKDVAHATVLILEHTIRAFDAGGDGLTQLEALSAEDINVFLSACLRVNSAQQRALAKCCGDALLHILRAESACDGRTCGGSQTDLLIVVQLASNVAQLGLADHPAVALLFDILYEKRSALMRRRLLLQTTMETLQITGEHTHQQLYALLVKGKLVA